MTEDTVEITISQKDLVRQAFKFDEILTGYTTMYLTPEQAESDLLDQIVEEINPGELWDELYSKWEEAIPQEFTEVYICHAQAFAEYLVKIQPVMIVAVASALPEEIREAVLSGLDE